MSIRWVLGKYNLPFASGSGKGQKKNSAFAFGTPSKCKCTRRLTMAVCETALPSFPVLRFLPLRTSLGLPSVCMLLVGLCFAMLCSILLVYRPRAPRSCIWHAHPLHNQRGRGPDGALLRC